MSACEPARHRDRPRLRWRADDGAGELIIILALLVTFLFMVTLVAGFSMSADKADAQYSAANDTLNSSESVANRLLNQLTQSGTYLTASGSGCADGNWHSGLVSMTKPDGSSGTARIDCTLLDVPDNNPQPTVGSSIVLFSKEFPAVGAPGNAALVSGGDSLVQFGNGLRLNTPICYRPTLWNPGCLNTASATDLALAEQIGDLSFADTTGSPATITTPACPVLTQRKAPPTTNPLPSVTTTTTLPGTTTTAPPANWAKWPLNVRETATNGSEIDLSVPGLLNNFWKCGSTIPQLTWTATDALYGTGRWPTPAKPTTAAAPPSDLAGSCRTETYGRLNALDPFLDIFARSTIPGTVTSCIRVFQPGDYSNWTQDTFYNNLLQVPANAWDYHRCYPDWNIFNCGAVPTKYYRMNYFLPGVYRFNKNFIVQNGQYSVRSLQYIVDNILQPICVASKGDCSHIFDFLIANPPKFAQSFHAPIVAGVPANPDDNSTQPQCMRTNAQGIAQPGVEWVFEPGTGLIQGPEGTGAGVNPPASISLCGMSAAQAVNGATQDVALYQIPYTDAAWAASKANPPDPDPQPHDALNSLVNQLDSAPLTIQGFVYAPRGRVKVGVSILNRNDLTLGYGLVAHSLDIFAWGQGTAFNRGLVSSKKRYRVLIRECPSDAAGAAAICPSSLTPTLNASLITIPANQILGAAGGSVNTTPDIATDILVATTNGSVTSSFDKWVARNGF